ncbi:MAG: hypothetical protein AAB263_10535 [Planctomycetota bacterium]
MRTTLILDDDLVREARSRAARLDLTMGDVINRALRRGLAEDPTRSGEATITYGDPSTPGPDDATLRSWSSRLDDDEAKRKAGT